MGQYTEAADTWEKAVRDAQQACTDARRKVREDHEAKRAELRASGEYLNSGAMLGLMREREAGLVAADEAIIAASDAAWAALGGAVKGDPLADWIIGNCRDQSFEAVGVLRLLPATLAELDAYAESQEWCGVWSDYRARAIRDGVINTPTNTAARRAVHDFVHNLCCPMDTRQANALDALLDAMILASNTPAEQVDA